MSRVRLVAFFYLKMKRGKACIFFPQKCQWLPLVVPSPHNKSQGVRLIIVCVYLKNQRGKPYSFFHNNCKGKACSFFYLKITRGKPCIFPQKSQEVSLVFFSQKITRGKACNFCLPQNHKR